MIEVLVEAEVLVVGGKAVDIILGNVDDSINERASTC